MSPVSPDFYLASAEGYGKFEEPRRAYRIKRLNGDVRDDYLLIRVSPPVIGQPYGLGAKDIEYLVVCTRFKGDTLFPINDWPAHVHIVWPRGDDIISRDVIHNDELHSMAWGELYRTEEEARNSVEPIARLNRETAYRRTRYSGV